MVMPQNIPTTATSSVKSRILIVGRANAGKTCILQRVCDAIDSPEVYRTGYQERARLHHSLEHDGHNIEDELVFENHHNYIFHDSNGFEAGGDTELKTVQDFVRRKSQEKQLKRRLHAIWYCIPMDNDRPSLDIRHFRHFCLDKNVPVIAVFTKFDQFKRNIQIKLEDEGRAQETCLKDEVEAAFHKHYEARLGETSLIIRLEKMHMPGQDCTALIEMTSKVISRKVAGLMGCGEIFGE